MNQDIICEHCDMQPVGHLLSRIHVIKWLPSVLFMDNGEDMVADCYSGKYRGNNKQASLIAYFALEQMLLQELTEHQKERCRMMEYFKDILAIANSGL